MRNLSPQMLHSCASTMAPWWFSSPRHQRPSFLQCAQRSHQDLYGCLNRHGQWLWRTFASTWSMKLSDGVEASEIENSFIMALHLHDSRFITFCDENVSFTSGNWKIGAASIIFWVWPSPSSSDHQDNETFLVGDPNLNLHLPLASWEGATPIL